MEVLIKDAEEDGLKEAVHQQDDDSDASADDHEFNDCTRTLASTDPTLIYDTPHLGIIKYTSAQPEQVNGWRRTTCWPKGLSLKF